MAGIEEITGARGDFYIRVRRGFLEIFGYYSDTSTIIVCTFLQRKWEYIDEVYLKRIFLRDGKDNSLTRLYEKLALT